MPRKTWKNFGNLPQDDYVKVVRQDPHNAKLLFAGMEHGIYASWEGKKLEKINIDLPNVSVRDLRIQKRSMISCRYSWKRSLHFR